MDRAKLEEIVNTHKWINSTRLDTGCDPDKMATLILQHHREETEFLIKKNRELATILIDVIDHVTKNAKKANSSKKFAMHPEFHEGLICAYKEVNEIIACDVRKIK